MMELRYGSCYPKALLGVNVALACIDAAISAFAFYQVRSVPILAINTLVDGYIISFLFLQCSPCFNEASPRLLRALSPHLRLTLFNHWCEDGSIKQLMRIQARNSHLGWTRQKVFHLMIGSSNMGYVVYFMLTLIAACKDWVCWSQSCGFIVMACPKILFLAAFLLLLSFCYIFLKFGDGFRVDLCHQANDEDDEDEESSPRENLLERASNKSRSSAESHRRCCSFRAIHVGSRQRVVILVTALIFILMITFAVLIWIGMGRNPIDSDLVARVYVDLFSIAILLLGGALACYGEHLLFYVVFSPAFRLLLFLKMRKVRSERASSEMWKVAGLAVVSVLCFSSSALVALFTDTPMLYHWHYQHVDAISTSLLLILYYLIGSSLPSAYVLWVMRELPPSIVVTVVEESRTIAFIHDSAATINPQRWTAATSLQNQVQMLLFFYFLHLVYWIIY
ncbi:hypothetical protein RHGRI_004936 [Rhododendron griersonianum]|uniref:THH1/TOM1/TOM3 domain-containing protein n=1 Tax=Rhododendron griersonianum TaxID=479676 RepID=A0AAV6LBI2_9ERIC|nr:hypothetical protein RHGRI_004936 [Rhododendron griersonianum]